MKIILLSLMLLFSSQTYAQNSFRDFWGNSARRLVEVFDTPFINPFLATVMGVCYFPRMRFRSIKGDVRKRYVYLKGFQKTVPYMQALQVSNYRRAINHHFNHLRPLRHRRGFKAVKAPVAVYIPGAFSDLRNRSVKLFSNFFHKRGYHVLAFPSPWGKEFVSKGPPFFPGSIENEAKSIYKMIRKGYERLQRRNLVKGEGVKLVGVSYGSYLSAIVSVLDAQSGDPIIKNGVTLFSPPYDFNRTLARFDDILKDVNDPYANFFLYTFFYKYLQICLHDHVSEQLLFDAKGLGVYVGFKRNLIRSLKKYLKVKHIKKWPLNSRKWEEKITFENYYLWYDPSQLNWLASEKGKLEYWLNKAKELGVYQHRILVSDDDFLNDPGVWDSQRFPNVLVVYGGGHFGYGGTRWFRRFLNAAFPAQKEGKDVYYELNVAKKHEEQDVYGL